MHSLSHRTFDRYFVYFHFPTFNHLTPYFLGVTIGYVLISRERLVISRVSALEHELKSPSQLTTFDSKVLRLALWFLLPSAAVLTVFSTIIWNGFDVEAGPISSFVYAGLHRLVWTSGVAWIALSCGFGQGGKNETICPPLRTKDALTRHVSCFFFRSSFPEIRGRSPNSGLAILASVQSTVLSGLSDPLHSHLLSLSETTEAHIL